LALSPGVSRSSDPHQFSVCQSPSRLASVSSGGRDSDEASRSPLSIRVHGFRSSRHRFCFGRFDHFFESEFVPVGLLRALGTSGAQIAFAPVFTGQSAGLGCDYRSQFAGPEDAGSHSHSPRCLLHHGSRLFGFCSAPPPASGGRLFRRSVQTSRALGSPGVTENRQNHRAEV